MFLKTFRYWIDLVLLGNTFQSLGAATRKDLSPKDFRLDFCMTRRLILFDWEDLSWLFGVKRSRRSTIYFGAMPFIALYVRSRILYAISCLIGSQCNWRSTGVICSELRVLNTRRTAQFWTYCSLSRTDRCNPYSSELQKKSLEEITEHEQVSQLRFEIDSSVFLQYSISGRSLFCSFHNNTFLQVDIRIKRYTYISSTSWDFDAFTSHAKTLNSCETFVLWSNQISDSDSNFFNLLVYFNSSLKKKNDTSQK